MLLKLFIILFTIYEFFDGDDDDDEGNKSPSRRRTRISLILSQPLIATGFITYVIIVFVVSMFLIFYVGPRHGTSNPLVYVTVTGTIGSLSVMGCKGLGTGFKQIIAGDTSQLVDSLTARCIDDYI